MGDMLIRGVNSELKKRLEENARKHGRSLSQEALHLMRQALATQTRGGRNLGDRLRIEMRDSFFTDDERAVVEASRKEPDREPPDLT